MIYICCTFFSSVYCFTYFFAGCLKESHESLFSPLLPFEKKYAINKLGIGTVDKVTMSMLVYSKHLPVQVCLGNFHFMQL